MRRNWVVAGAAFACAALLTASGLMAEEPKAPKKVPKDAIKEMMTKVHHGDKSPLARTAAEVKKDAPDWDQLAKDAKELTAMADMLKGAGLYTDPDKYIAGTTALTKAIGEKDAKAAAVAFNGVSRSCSACHYGVPK
jgi:hypothetical protein